MEKKLYRSRQNKKIAGIAAGIGEYFEVDPVLVRALFLVLILGSGAGLLIYIVLWIIVPFKPVTEPFVPNESGELTPQSANDFATEYNDLQARRHRRRSLGLILIIAGALILLDSLQCWIHYTIFDNLWPLILIGIGIYFFSGTIRFRKEK